LEKSLKITPEQIELLDEGLDLLKNRVLEKIGFNNSDLKLYKSSPDSLEIIKEHLAEHQKKLAQIIVVQAQLLNA